MYSIALQHVQRDWIARPGHATRGYLSACEGGKHNDTLKLVRARMRANVLKHARRFCANSEALRCKFHGFLLNFRSRLICSPWASMDKVYLQ